MFYRFNAHKHSAPNHNRMAGKDHDGAARKTESVHIRIQRRWAKFTDIRRGALPRILLVAMLGNLGCSAVLLLLCVRLVTSPEPNSILPKYDKISMPSMPDQFKRQEDSQNLTEFELYLDSLERAFRTDSINEAKN